MRQVLIPPSLEDFWSDYAANPRAALYAGGTDLLVRLRRGLVQADSLICLERLEELKTIRKQDDRVFLGAGATLQQLMDSPVVQFHFPVLHQAISVLGSPPIRHMATLGGNLATASPAGDTLPPLYVLEAEVELWSPEATRRMPVAEFIQGPGKTQLKPQEILGGVWLTKSAGRNLHHFEKVGTRQALAICIASLAAAGEVDSEGVVRSIRLAWGSVGPTVVSSPEIDGILEGDILSAGGLAEVGRKAQSFAKPISDIRASREYRRALVANLPLRVAGWADSMAAGFRR